MNWTEDQRSAIEARNDSVLVSAAAGSGKTAVLVERVLSLLRQGGRVDRMLIVTFTRAAAGEMRERIGAQLEKEAAQNAHLRRQLSRLNRASICTLHVFCHRLLQEFFEAAGIDPLCRIAEENILSSLKKRALDEALEEAYAAPDENMRALISQFEDTQIVALISSLYSFLMARPEPFAWAAEMSADAGADLPKWEALLQSLCLSALEGARELLPEMEGILHEGGGPIRYAPTLETDAALTYQLLEECRNGTLKGGKCAFGRLNPSKAPPEENPDCTARYKEVREEWKKRVNDARALLPVDREKAQRDLLHPLPALRALCALTERLHALYFSYKQKKNYLDYTDLEHLALKVLKNPAVKAQAAARFDALFIDEYQDVSAIQEAIIAALHETGKNTLFMVGDVKQSIYRFRQADPTLFLRKYQAYSPDAASPARKILLQQNFRSDENVLLAVNQVFAHAMREKETEIEYDEAAMLRPGGNNPFGAAAEIHLMTAESEDDETEGEITQGYRYEAAFAARRIRELMRTATVRDPNGGERPLKYRDIALLLRYASGRAPQIARVLQMEGIPVYSDADAQFYDLPEVIDLMNLLRVLDNPLQDIPLLSALRCPVFGFTEEDLARIRLVDRSPGTPFHRAFQKAMEAADALSQKCRDAWERLAKWRFLARNLPVDTLIWRVLEESGLYMRAGAMEDGDLRQANLRLMAEMAQGEAAAEGLSAFLRETTRLHAGDDGKAAKTLGENEDVVRILTIHKSKGLEFPVVFLMEMARPFRKGGGEENLLRLHGQYGMGLKYIDGERRLTRETAARTALQKIAEREAKAEEARLLYVGMTRARERLILLGSPKRLAKAASAWRRPATPYAAGMAACMLDWVMVALGGLQKGPYIAKNGSVWQMETHPVDDLAAPVRQRSVSQPIAPEGAPDEQTIRRMERRIAASPPLKTSVTAIAKRLRDENDDWESPADKRVPPMEATSPAFWAEKEQEMTPALRGTATHRVLGLIDLDAVRGGYLAHAVNDLCKKGVLSETEREGVRMAWLKGFFESDIGKRALNAAVLHREWAFNMKGPGRMLVQGVIDLCFLEDDQWVLVDYKTDHAGAEEILERYRQQILWYARALKTITGKPVQTIVLFALREGKAIDVPADAELTLP